MIDFWIFQYIQTNLGQKPIHVDSLAEELQKTYREYARRKQNAFRASVAKAYRIAMDRYNLDNHNVDSVRDEEEKQNENSGLNCSVSLKKLSTTFFGPWSANGQFIIVRK